MKQRILLVSPRIPTTYWSYKYALPFIRKDALLPPLGLLTVAGLLPDSYRLRLVDMNVEELRAEQIEWADVVFVSAMLVQRRSFEEVVALCRRCGTPVAAGGPYPSSSYEAIEGVDHFVLDEAELTLPPFLRDWERGAARRLYRDERKPELSLTPLPRFDLIDVSRYESMPLQFSRGCPFDCEFCDIIEMFGRKPRTKSPEQFMREVEHLYRTGFRGSLFIVDDNFVGNKRNVKELLPALASWQRAHGYPFTLSTEASITLAQDEQLLDLMVAAGFTMVFIGIETPDAETLARSGKTQNLREDILGSVIRIQTRGIEVSGGFIVGFDGEGEDIFERQRAFIQRAGIPTAMVGLLIALPNTRLYRRLKAEGRILSESGGNNTHDFQLNFRPDMPREKLLSGYKWLLRRAFSPASYFERSFRLMERFSASRLCRQRPSALRIRRRMRPRDIAAFFRSLFRQSFSFYGGYYLRYLFRVVRHDAALIPQAVTVAVRGHHFIRITREILQADAFAAWTRDMLASFTRQAAALSGKGREAAGRLPEVHLRGVLRALRSAHRAYRRLGGTVQLLAAEALAEFEQRCRLLLQGTLPVYN